VRKLLQRLIDRFNEKSDIPRASFSIDGIEDDGRIKVALYWNKAFIKKIRSMGFEAETEEDCVQLFFYTSMMRPVQLAGDLADEAVQSSVHPQLSSIKNEFVG